MAVQYLSTSDDLERTLDASTTGPVWILKHSDDCGLSARGFEAYLAHSEQSTVPHWVLVVQDVPGLSRALATRLNIQHETPQALLIVDRQAQWNASHRRITAAALSDAEG